MNKMEHIEKVVNEFDNQGLVETHKITTQQKQSDRNATLSGVGNKKVNDTSIPYEIDGDDEVQQRVNDPKFANKTPMKRDKSIYPDREDRLPKKDRISSKIRNDDNPADVDI
jgi:hypothetical protein